MTEGVSKLRHELYGDESVFQASFYCKRFAELLLFLFILGGGSFFV
jgi:hypothetical protein